jgi:hypothetical protein
MLAAFVAAAAALLTFPAPLQACPECMAAADQQVQEGFLWGLMFMMVSPWVAIGTIGGGLYLAFRRERREAVEEFLRSEAALPASMLEESDVKKG